MTEITNQIYSPRFNHSEKSQPFMLLLHGWGSNEHDLPGLAEALSSGLDYVSVRAPFVLPGTGGSGFAWFIDPVVSRSKRDNEAKLGGDILLSWLESQEKSGQIQPDRPIIVVGFSQGAAMSSHILLRDELVGRLNSVVMLSGYLPFNSDDIVPASSTSDSKSCLPVFHGWGNADDIVEPSESLRAKAWFTNNFVNLTQHTYSGMTHSICLEEARDISNFLADCVK
jgi:phospholipase/carboxylesterase